ncbi:MAG: tetratricopeptide repeat protein [Candidatus Rokubacteria bacterium]|nr:tetratricopeptide repeat protein [Candidatus Rokubacteria bacterium]
MDAELAAFLGTVRPPDEAIDLARAALQIARIEHDGLAPEPCLLELSTLAERSGVRRVDDPFRALDRLREFLFEEEGYRGNAEDYFDPRNSYLNDVIARKLGIPITLSLLTMEVGRRVGLTIDGVGLPGHFIVRAHVGHDSVLVDPFNGGRILDEQGAAEVVAHALGREVPLTDVHFASVTKSQVIARILMNLRGIYVQREEWRKALAVIERLLVLDTRSPVHLRDRGTMLMKLGDFHAGAAEWERYLTRYPNARDADRLRGQLRQIRQALASRN